MVDYLVILVITRLSGWLVFGWLVGWLFLFWLVGLWLVGCFVFGWLMGCLYGVMVGFSMVGWLFCVNRGHVIPQA